IIDKPSESRHPKRTGVRSKPSCYKPPPTMVFNASRLLGKTVLITGASSGIGAATAVLFAKVRTRLPSVPSNNDDTRLGRTSSCWLDERRRSRPCNRLALKHTRLRGSGGWDIRANPTGRLRSQCDCELWSKVPSGLRNVDILVNNAGYVVGREHVGDIDESVIEGMFATNVFGLVAMTQLLVRDFKARNSGHVINIGSIAGIEAYSGGSIYTATKHAVNAFSGSLLRELVNTPIRVTEIQPGMVETEFSLVRFRGDADAAKAVYTGLQPLTAEDIAEEIVWAASRPAHVNIAETLIFPVNQASAIISHRAT
ncbi:unnamed protein product, partial [Mycena citricolor]